MTVDPDKAKTGATERPHQLLIVDSRSLSELQVKASVFQYLREVLARRDYIWEDSKAKAFRTQRSYRWWKLWLVVLPMLDAALYGVIFGLLLQTSRGIDNYVGFLFLGLTYFSFMSRMFSAGAGLIPSHRNLIRAFAFPRAVIVFSQSLRYFWDSLPAAIVAVLVALALQWQKPIAWTALYVIPLYLLIFIFGTGLMFLTARLTAFTADIRVGIDLASRAWMFSSGIFFSIERFANNEKVYAIMSANPGHIFLEAIRNSVLYGNGPSWGEWLTLSAWAFGTLIVGFLVFWQAEDKYVWA